MSKHTLKVGLLLGWKQIRHASKWTTSLIIFVMMLTFLNLVVVSGILVGLIEGSVKAYRDQFTGDVFISDLEGEEYIKQSGSLLATLPTIPGIASYTTRSTEPSIVEANYRSRRDPEEPRDEVSTLIVGFDPVTEDAVTGLSRHVVEGSYLSDDDQGYVLVGSLLLHQYAPDFGDQFPTLLDVHPGTKVRIRVGERLKEYTVKGVIDSKVDETARRVFMTENEFLNLTGRTNLNINEVAIRTVSPDQAQAVKQRIIQSGIDKNAVVQTSREGLPQALEDVITTFDLLGNGISSIGLVVSSITIFIVVFVNAITRRKYIGILKGIGIRASAIEFSYVFQSLLYVAAGAALAVAIIYGFLVPFFNAHPIDFPFSDGILVAPLSGTIVRLVILVLATVVAGYIPAWMIIKRNTLDAILGR